MKKKEYALYKGEECLAIGTIKSIAKQMHVKEETIKFYMTPVYIKRRNKSKRKKYRILICLDDEDDIDVDFLMVENKELKIQNKKLEKQNKQCVKAINEASCYIRIHNEIFKEIPTQATDDLLEILEKCSNYCN